MNIYIYCNESIFILLEDYLNSILFKNIRVNIIKYNNNNYQKILTNIQNIISSIVIFIQTIPDISIINYISINTTNSFYLLNTEQLSRNKYLKILLNLFNTKNLSFIDYSLSNIHLTKHKIFHLPYPFNPIEISKLILFLKTPKIYDIAILVPLSPHRKNIIDSLIQKNIKVNIISAYGDKRDKEISKAKILLNIHFDNNYTIFEHIRCNRWLYASHLIISEESFNLDANFMALFKNNLIISPYDNLVNTVINTLKNYTIIRNSIKINYKDILKYNKQYYSQIPFITS